MHKIPPFLLAGLLCIGGCAPSPTSTADTVNSGAEYTGNVSTLYSIGSTSDGTTEFEWKDSVGDIQKLTDYRGKPVLLTFWRSNNVPSQGQIASLDSLAADMKDSVKVIGIAGDNVAMGHSFQIVSNYVQSHGVKLQVVVDSQSLVKTRYVSNGTLYITETFVLKADGSVMAQGILPGTYGSEELKVFVRAAYK